MDESGAKGVHEGPISLWMFKVGNDADCKAL